MKKSTIITISILSAFLIFFIILFVIFNVKNVNNDMVETSATPNEYNSEINNINNVSNQAQNSTENSTEIVNNTVNNSVQKGEEKPKEPIKKYKEVNETVYAITTVHLRESDSLEGKILATLTLGESIKRTGIGNNGWSKVDYNGKIGYISTEYISKDKPPEQVTISLDVNSERKIDSSKPMVALTFDDGPNPNTTPRILDTLEKYKCVATFFDLGTCMSKYPNITKREESIGCEVGSHTYEHKNLDNLSKEQILEDIKKAEDIYKQTLGHDLKLVRPPYGNANSNVKLTLNYPLINWDVDTKDWKNKNKADILKQIKDVGNLNGRIVLMHSIYNATADAVEELVPQLLKDGYQLVTVSELAKYKNVPLKTHTAYWGLK